MRIKRAARQAGAILVRMMVVVVVVVVVVVHELFRALILTF